MSDGYSGMIIVQLDELAKKTEEEGTTNALIRGVLAKMKMDGHAIGGFAGIIQAFVPNYLVANYQKEMDKIFGNGSCEVLKIRKYGGIKVL